MHVVIALLYSFVIYLSALAYAAIAGGPVLLIAAAGPFIISAAVAALIGLDWLLTKVVP